MPFNIIISGITGGTQISTVQILQCTDGDCNSCTLIPSYGSVLLSTLNTPGITITNINDNTSYIKIIPNGVCSGNTLCLPIQNKPTPTPTPTPTATPTPTPTPTATPTPTPTPTVVCLPPTIDSVTCINDITPTPTPTPTITPTPTPTPTPTIIPTQLYWSITNEAGGRLRVYDKDDNVLLNEHVGLTDLSKNGILTISDSVLPYKIKGSWENGSGNVVNYIVCDMSASQLFVSSPLGPSQSLTEEDFIVNPTPVNVSVTMWKNGQIPPSCS